MAKLIYSMNMSLDGYMEDAGGRFDWAVPDAELHSFYNELERSIGTSLYGRRLYEAMVYWEDVDTAGMPPEIAEYAEIWRAGEKVVYSRTLKEVSSARSRIERVFDPEAVRELKESATADLSVGGPELAAQTFAAGLVDECKLVIHPISLGGGKPALPRDQRLRLELLDERRFSSGAALLHYAVRA